MLVSATPLASVSVRGQVVGRESPRQLLVDQGLEVARRREVPGLAVAPGERRVRHLADERLDEGELAALDRSRVRVAHEQLPPDEPGQPALHLGGIERRDRGKAVDGEGVPEDGGGLEQGAVGGLEGVEAGRDE